MLAIGSRNGTSSFRLTPFGPVVNPFCFQLICRSWDQVKAVRDIIFSFKSIKHNVSKPVNIPNVESPLLPIMGAVVGFNSAI